MTLLLQYVACLTFRHSLHLNGCPLLYLIICIVTSWTIMGLICTVIISVCKIVQYNTQVATTSTIFAKLTFWTSLSRLKRHFKILNVFSMITRPRLSFVLDSRSCSVSKPLSNCKSLHTYELSPKSFQ